MSIEYFVEIASQKTTIHKGKDQIPGTDKVRTYCGNSSLYSKASSFDRMSSRSHSTLSTKK